jgi:hypothetical protein
VTCQSRSMNRASHGDHDRDCDLSRRGCRPGSESTLPPWLRLRLEYDDAGRGESLPVSPAPAARSCSDRDRGPPAARVRDSESAAGPGRVLLSWRPWLRRTRRLRVTPGPALPGSPPCRQQRLSRPGRRPPPLLPRGSVSSTV